MQKSTNRGWKYMEREMRVHSADQGGQAAGKQILEK